MAGESLSLVAKMNVNVSGHGNNNGTSNHHRGSHSNNNRGSPRQSQGSKKEGVISGFLRHVSGSGGPHSAGGGISNNNQSPGGHSMGGHSMGGVSMGGMSNRSGSMRESRKAIESGTMSSVHSLDS